MHEPSDDHRSMASAMRTAHRVTSIGLELVIPAGGGLWLDNQFGTIPWLTILGLLIGGYLATRGLMQLLKDLEKE